MSADDRTRALGALPSEVAHALIARLPASEARSSLTLLSYPEDTAGRFMTPDYAWVRPTMTAGEAIDHLRRTGRNKETLNVVYIVDERGFLVEDLRLGGLVLADASTIVTEIPDPRVVWMLDTTPREEVVRLFEKYDRVALPVVDAQQRMLGIITVDDILDVAEEEATEDIQKIGGMDALDAPYMRVGLAEMLRKRGGWLAVLFVGEMLTATAMGHFEAEIAQAVVLALFVPLIISSGGNSGSQAASIIIRALALKELGLADWWRVMRRELLSGVALGGGLGAIGFARIALWQKIGLNDYGPHYLLVGATVWLSLVGVVTFGTLCGSMLPFLMRRLGLDPATSSAPFVATLVDVTGLVIYFRVAGMILRGALL
jgi:magnesium transporter